MQYQLLLLLVISVRSSVAVQNHWPDLQTLSSEDKVAECISKQFERFYIRYSVLVSTHTEIHGNYWRSKSSVYKVNYNTGLQLLSVLKLSKMFIIILDNVDQFEKLLRTLRGTQCWNPRGQFIVSIYNCKNITEIFEVAWKYYVLHINVIQLEMQSPMVYTYFPYNSTNCSVNFTPAMVFSCNETLPGDLFPSKVPDNLNGCEIKLMAYHIPPYVMNISANREDPTVAGLEVTIMHMIAEDLNLTERYISHNFTSWGEKLPNGTMTNMYKALDDHDAELIFGMVPLNSPEDYEFESTLIHVTESLIWWVPMADHMPRWKRPMKLFHPQVWFLILAAFPVNGLLWWLFGKSKETSDNYKVWYRSILASWSVLLQVTHAQPRYTVTRILYLFFAIFSLLIYTAHESVLVSTLTKPHHERQIKTVEELLDSKLKYGFFPIIAESYNDSSNWIHREIRSNFIVCPLTEECLNRTAFERDFAVVKNRRQAMYMMKKYYLHPDGTPMIYGFTEGNMYIPKFLVTAGYPLLEKFNELLLSMQANGFIGKWDKDITFNQAHKDESQLTALSIGHMALLFVNLLIGLTISFIVFIVEIILKRRKDKKCGKIKSYHLPFIQ